jgi:Sec-independent protein secretion pathway component TatC
MILATSIGGVLLTIFVVIPTLVWLLWMGIQNGFTRKEREVARTRELRRIREQNERRG